MNFFRLISIENFKLWKRRSVRVLFIVMIGLALCYCAGGKYIDYASSKNEAGSGTSQAADWRQQAQAAVQTLPAQIQAAKQSDSRVDDTTIGIYEKNLAEAKYRLEHNLAPKSKPDTVWGWMTLMADNQQVPGIGNFIALFCIIFISTAIAGEFTEGTMKMAVSRPFSRAQILSAKTCSAVLFMLILTGAAFGVTFLGTGLLFGFKGLGASALLWTGSRILSIPEAAYLLAIYGLNLLNTLFYMALAFLLATLFRSRSIATGVSIFMLLIGASLFRLLTIYFDWGKFTAFPVSDFSGYIVSGTSLPGTSLGFALIVCGVFTAVFVALGYLSFQKRDI